MDNFSKMLMAEYETDDINTISDDDLRKTMGKLGYDKRTSRDAIQGYRKYKKKRAAGNTFSFMDSETGGNYNVTSDEDNIKLSGSGRRKGRAVGANNVASMLNLGNDVSSFAGFLTNIQKSKLAEQKAIKEKQDATNLTTKEGADLIAEDEKNDEILNDDDVVIENTVPDLVPGTVPTQKGDPNRSSFRPMESSSDNVHPSSEGDVDNSNNSFWSPLSAGLMGTGIIGSSMLLKKGRDKLKTLGMSDAQKRQYYYQKKLENRKVPKVKKSTPPIFDYKEEQWMKTKSGKSSTPKVVDNKITSTTTKPSRQQHRKNIQKKVTTDSKNRGKARIIKDRTYTPPASTPNKVAGSIPKSSEIIKNRAKSLSNAKNISLNKGGKYTATQVKNANKYIKESKILNKQLKVGKITKIAYNASLIKLKKITNIFEDGGKLVNKFMYYDKL